MKQHRAKTIIEVISASIIAVLIAVVGFKYFQNAGTTNASSVDINAYIKSRNIKPLTKVTQDLHKFEMFHYGTKDELPNGVVFHYTDNQYSYSAKNEAEFEFNNWQHAFVHTFVDAKTILNIHDTNYGAWGAGPHANSRFVQFELVTARNTDEFAHSIANAAEYTAMICYRYGLKPSLVTKNHQSGTIWTHHNVTEYLGGTTHVDPDAYLAKFNYNTSKFLVLVKQYYNAMVSARPYGSAIAYNKYATVKKSAYTIWQSLDFKTKKGNSTAMLDQLVHIKAVYKHSNGGTYYSLYNKSGKWLGYINSTAVKIESGGQGHYYDFDKYVTLTKKGYTIWGSFDWTKKKSNSTSDYEKTYLAKGLYNHFNGTTYYSLYDNKGNWKGYVSSAAAEVASTPGGAAIADTKYVSIVKKGSTIWDDFNWRVSRGRSDSMLNRIAQVRRNYNHANGKTYYSLYRNDGSWIGYISADAVKNEPNPQGAPVTVNKYVTIQKSGYSLWNDFSWTKERNSSTKILGKTYLAKREYNHFNGTKYLSLYAKSGAWMGYISSAAVGFASNAAGVSQADGNVVQITKSKYTLWNDFGWKASKGTTTNLVGQTAIAKYDYNHFNGTRYLSLYDANDKWLGYLSADATEVSDSDVVSESVPGNLYGIKTTGLSASKVQFLQTLISYALPVADKYNLYPSIIVSQGITESAWGTSALVTGASAYFGIKADASWDGPSYIKSTHETIDGKDTIINAAFRKYPSLGDSVEGYAIKVTGSSLYTALLRSNSASWSTAVQCLSKYATNPNYVKTISNGITSRQLNKLDSVH